MSEKAFSFLDMPDRSTKPRVDGMTMCIDQGLGLDYTKDLLSLCSEYIDLWKLGWATTQLQSSDLVKAKIQLLRSHDISICNGGTLLELSEHQDKAELLFDEMVNLGYDSAEISSGSLDIDSDRVTALIQSAKSRNLRVFCEVGKKLVENDLNSKEYNSGHEVCHDTNTHENTDHDNKEDCEAAGHKWMGDSTIVADDDEEAFEYDPHSWLNPQAFKAQMNVVLDALVTKFPAGEADFKANAKAYGAQLDLLDVAFTEAFGTGGSCTTNKKIVANHNAYAYIAQKYDIDILTVHGLDPEGEPSVEDIAEVVEQIKEDAITVLYVEEYTDQSAVAAIVDETGVEVEILYTMELPPKDSNDNYLTLMAKNLASLVKGMGC